MTERLAAATFKIPPHADKGVRCLQCASRLCAQVETIEGVARVECDPRGTMRVEYDSSRVSEADLSVATERYGIALAGVYAHAVWHVTGLD